MMLHGNAALSWQGRRRLAVRVVEEDWTLRAAAAAAGVSVRCARKWVAEIRCGAVKRTMHLTMSMTVDGVLADSSERTCHKRADCWTYTFASDAPGDQVWCATATVRIGGHTVGPVTRCETDASV